MLQGGGEPFTAFVDALLHVHGTQHGLVDADIDTTIRTNIRDGGIDTSVRREVAGDPTGWFSGAATAWQYKGTEYKNVVIKGMLSGEAAKARISVGDAFRLAVADSPPDDTRREWERDLWEQARAINAAAPQPRVVGGDDLAKWASRYPALVLGFFRRGFSDVILHLDAWAANARQATRVFISVPAWQGARERLEQHFDLKRVAERVVWPIQGEAGVGKTRLTFEVASAYEVRITNDASLDIVNDWQR